MGKDLTLTNEKELKDHGIAAWGETEGRGHHAASNWFFFLKHPLLPFFWRDAVLREPQLRAQQSLLDLKGICILKGCWAAGGGPITINNS